MKTSPEQEAPDSSATTDTSWEVEEVEPEPDSPYLIDPNLDPMSTGGISSCWQESGSDEEAPPI